MLCTEEVGFAWCVCPTNLSTTRGRLEDRQSIVISLAFSWTLLLLFQFPALLGVALSASAYPSVPYMSPLSLSCTLHNSPELFKVLSLIVWLSYFWTSEAELVRDMFSTQLRIVDFDSLDSLLTSVLILDSPHYLSRAFLVRKWFSNFLDGVPFL